MATLAKVDGLPRSNERRTIGEKDVCNARFNNQFFLQGTDPTFPQGFPNDKDVIVFLEFVQSTGTFTIEDANGNVLSGALVSQFGDAHAPLRLDGGVKLNGTILGAKGFYLPIK